jgi:Flp pilus assembly protein TadB
VNFMTRKSVPKIHKRSRLASLFVLPIISSCIVIAITAIAIYYFELNAVLIYVVPVVYLVLFNVIRWVKNRKLLSKTKQKILYLA